MNSHRFTLAAALAGAALTLTLPVAAQDKADDLRGEPLIAMSPYQVFEKCGPAVMRVVVQDPKGVQVIDSATGFFVSADGKLITAAHILKDAQFIRLQLADKSVAFVERVLAVDHERNLALLQANVKDVPFLEPSDLKLQKRDTVYAIGNSKTVSQTFSEGRIEKMPGDRGTLILTDASVSAMSPGAPFIDYVGKVVGVAPQPGADATRIASALPIAHAVALIEGEHTPGEKLASAGRERILPEKPKRDGGGAAENQNPNAVANPQHPQPLAPKAPPIAGYTSVGFDTLKKYDYEPVEPDQIAAQKPEDQPIPAEVKAVHGKKVAIQGYMVPVDFQDGGTNEFILVNVTPGCFFCQQPLPNDWIEVQTEGGKRFPYAGDEMIIVTGTLDVGPIYEGAFLRSIFRLKADNVRPSKQ